MQKIENSQYRFYIQIRQSQRAETQTTWEELKTVTGQGVPPHTKDKLWFRKLTRGHKRLEDEHRPQNDQSPQLHMLNLSGSHQRGAVSYI